MLCDMSKIISVSVASQSPINKSVTSIHTIGVPKENEYVALNTDPVKQGLENYPCLCVSYGNGIIIMYIPL